MTFSLQHLFFQLRDCRCWYPSRSYLKTLLATSYSWWLDWLSYQRAYPDMFVAWNGHGNHGSEAVAKKSSGTDRLFQDRVHTRLWYSIADYCVCHSKRTSSHTNTAKLDTTGTHKRTAWELRWSIPHPLYPRKAFESRNDVPLPSVYAPVWYKYIPFDWVLTHTYSFASTVTAFSSLYALLQRAIHTLYMEEEWPPLPKNVTWTSICL